MWKIPKLFHVALLIFRSASRGYTHLKKNGFVFSHETHTHAKYWVCKYIVQKYVVSTSYFYRFVFSSVKHPNAKHGVAQKSFFFLCYKRMYIGMYKCLGINDNHTLYYKIQFVFSVITTHVCLLVKRLKNKKI